MATRKEADPFVVETLDRKEVCLRREVFEKHHKPLHRKTFVAMDFDGPFEIFGKRYRVGSIDNHCVVIDDEDYSWIRLYDWRFVNQNGKDNVVTFVTCYGEKKMYPMVVLVAGGRFGRRSSYVSEWNRNALDCRLENIMLVPFMKKSTDTWYSCQSTQDVSLYNKLLSMYVLQKYIFLPRRPCLQAMAMQSRSDNEFSVNPIDLDNCLFRIGKTYRDAYEDRQMFFLMDETDFENVRKLTWRFPKGKSASTKPQIFANVDRRRLLLKDFVYGRLMASYDDGLQVIHVNGVCTDFRYSNLALARIASRDLSLVPSDSVYDRAMELCDTLRFSVVKRSVVVKEYDAIEMIDVETAISSEITKRQRSEEFDHIY